MNTRSYTLSEMIAMGRSRSDMSAVDISESELETAERTINDALKDRLPESEFTNICRKVDELPATLSQLKDFSEWQESLSAEETQKLQAEFVMDKANGKVYDLYIEWLKKNYQETND